MVKRKILLSLGNNRGEEAGNWNDISISLRVKTLINLYY